MNDLVVRVFSGRPALVIAYSWEADPAGRSDLAAVVS